MPVGGDGVHPENALAADGGFQFRRRGCPAHGVVGFRSDVVADHCVAQGVGVVGGPRQQVVLQDGAVVGEVDGLLTRLRAVFRRHFNRHDPGLDVAVGSVVSVLQRVVWIELQLVEGEAQRRRDRVRPSHVLVETDGHPAGVEQAGAHDIDFAGQGGVDEVKSRGAVPRIVGIAEQDAAPRGAQRRADGHPVAADAVRQGPRGGLAGDLIRSRCFKRGRLADFRAETAQTVANAHPKGQPGEVVGVDLGNPGRTRATFGQ